MDRRTFLKRIGQGICFSSGFFLCPSGLMAKGEKNVFDLGMAGQNLIAQKKWDQAVAVLKEAVALDPKSDWAYGLLGRAYHGMGQMAQALSCFKNAAALNPYDTYSRMMIDVIRQRPYEKIQKPNKPITDLEKAAIKEEREMAGQLATESGLHYQIKKIVIDAGHGGFDSGAVGKSGLMEKDVTLDIAQLLHEKIKTRGKYRSYLTRTGDYYVPLSARTATANQYQADLFISVHINANANPDPKGSETFFCSKKASSQEAANVAAFENSVLKFDKPHKRLPDYFDIEDVLFQFEQQMNWKQSEIFAGRFQDRFSQSLPLKSRGIHSADFFVLRRAKMPSILLELGFISNPDDEALLKNRTFRQNLAESIATGLS